MGNRFRWEIMAERRRKEAAADIIFGVFIPLAIVSFSIIWGIYG